jgi:hypothetical protein
MLSELLRHVGGSLLLLAAPFEQRPQCSTNKQQQQSKCSSSASTDRPSQQGRSRAEATNVGASVAQSSKVRNM